MPYGYQFYQCDADKSEKSMLPRDASPIFSNTRKGRRALWQYVKDTYADDYIFIATADRLKVKKCIIDLDNGNPLEANQYIDNGCILEWEIL